MFASLAIAEENAEVQPLSYKENADYLAKDADYGRPIPGKFPFPLATYSKRDAREAGSCCCLCLCGGREQQKREAAAAAAPGSCCCLCICGKK